MSWLERMLGVESIVQQCLTDPDSATSLVEGARKSIIHQDWTNTIRIAKSQTSLKHIVTSDEVALCWSRVWDSSLPVALFDEQKCRYCNTQVLPDLTYFYH